MPARIGPKTPAAKALGLLSDIHGNVEALDAVLEELSRNDVTQIVVAGDSFLGGPDPLGVYRRLTRLGARVVRGVSDTALITFDPASLPARTADERAKRDAFAAARNALGDLAIHDIRKWPERLRIPLIDGRELLVVHGSPRDPMSEISHDMTEDELRVALDDEVADFVVCGASHLPFRIHVDGTEVLSVGSVGAAPEGRVAHFAILVPRMGSAEISQTFVDY